MLLGSIRSILVCLDGNDRIRRFNAGAETVFGLAGVGRMLVEAIFARDYPVVQAFTVMIAVSYVAINLIVDLSYSYLDPRIRPQ